MHLRSVLILLGLCTLPLSAQAGNGGNGDLDITPMAINANLTLTVTGGANQGFAVYVSDAPAALSTPFGTVWIDPSSLGFGLLLSGNLSPAGSAALSVFVPNDPNLLSFVGYIQGAVVDPGHASGIALTRAIRVDFENPDLVPRAPAALPGARAEHGRPLEGRPRVRGRRRQRHAARARRDQLDGAVPALHAIVVGRPEHVDSARDARERGACRRPGPPLRRHLDDGDRDGDLRHLRSGDELDLGDRVDGHARAPGIRPRFSTTAASS